MATFTLTIGVASCAKYIAEYLGLIESVSSDVSKLRHEPLQSAIAWFNNAKNCTDEELMGNYIHDARREFMKAISLEDNENKISAILGLCLCQHILGDETNATNNLQKIDEVVLTNTEKIKGATKGVGFAVLVAHVSLLTGKPILPISTAGKMVSRIPQWRIDCFERFKQNAHQLSEKL